jgi:hypothetical protein
MNGMNRMIDLGTKGSGVGAGMVIWVVIWVVI